MTRKTAICLMLGSIAAKAADKERLVSGITTDATLRIAPQSYSFSFDLVTSVSVTHKGQTVTFTPDEIFAALKEGKP